MLRAKRLDTIGRVNTGVGYAAPRPPLLGRLPAQAWLALDIGAASLFALLVYFTMPPSLAPIFLPAHGVLALTRFDRIGLALLAGAPVLAARRTPVPVLGVLLSISVAASLFQQRAWPFQFAAGALVAFVAATHTRRISVPAALATLAVWLGQWLLTSPWTGVDYGKTLTLVLADAAAWVIGNSIQQRRDYTATVREQAAASAVIAERLRIARELHDAIGHSIGIIAIQAGVGNRVIETQPAEARKALEAIELTSRDTLHGLRRMLVALRRADADPAGTEPAPGLADLARLAATTTAAGVQVNMHWHGSPAPLPPDIDLSAFRIVQEAVTNVVRHSAARQCEVSVDYRETGITIEIVDDGPARPTTGGAGFGIAGMRERVALLRGEFSAGPRPEGGFRVAAVLPR